MGNRGRQSSAELTVIGPRGIETIKRPDPPEELTDEQAREWQEIVNRMPADWFPRETHCLLIQLCRHNVEGRHIAAMIARMKAAPKEEFVLQDYNRLLNMQERESRAIASMTTKLRLSHQATKRQERTAKSTMHRRPWMTDDPA